MSKYIIICLLILGLVSCDIFRSKSNQKFNNLQLKNNTDIKNNWKVSYGDFYFKDNVMYCRNIKNDSLIENHKLPWRTIVSNSILNNNFSFEFEFKLIKSQLVEMILNLNTIENNYTRIYVYDIEKNIHIGKGNWINNNNNHGFSTGGPTLKTANVFIKKDDWNHFKVICKNNEYIIYFNNICVLNYKDEFNTLQSKGFIGIICNNETDFRNIQIK